jgi:PIN domain nuclease of toxin-antitoxin system
MSRYLIDTNIVIAFVNQTVNRLPVRLQTLLSNPELALSVSVISPWEISIKAALGKLHIDANPRELPVLLARYGFPLLPMTIDHALEVAHPEPATKDPFDRLLLAVCACEGMKLVTTDEKLAGHRLVY